MGNTITQTNTGKIFHVWLQRGTRTKVKHKVLTSQTRIADENEDDVETACLVSESTSHCLDAESTANESKVPDWSVRDYWVLDSGCLEHLTYDRAAFSVHKSVVGKSVDLGAESTATIVGCGDVEVKTRISGKMRKIILKKFSMSLIYDTSYSLFQSWPNMTSKLNSAQTERNCIACLMLRA